MLKRMEDELVSTKGGTLLISGDDLLRERSPQDNTCVLFVPGMSGKAHSDRFKPLVELCLTTGLPIARLAAWEGSADANAETYAHWQSVVAGAVSTLLNKEFTSIIGIGKSFGGGLLLSQPIPGVTKKILWAPAIGFAQAETLSELRDKPLEGYTLLDLKLSSALLAKETANITIIHGDADEVVSVANSKEIAAAVSSGMVEVIRGAGHSFDKPEHAKELLEYTGIFLKN